MLISDEAESDVFFDCNACFSSEEFGYEIWMNEPQSVNERRGSFLYKMDLLEFATRNEDSMMELERATECSGAVSSSLALLTNRAEESLVCYEREMDCEANCMVDECESTGVSSLCVHESEQCQNQSPSNEWKGVGKNKVVKWWKSLVSVSKHIENMYVSETTKPNSEKSNTKRMMVKQNKKGCSEFTAVYMAQEIQAHKGHISTMKFSPDGQYLASSGEDGVVRVWRVTSTDSSSKSFTDYSISQSSFKEGKTRFGKKKLGQAPVLIPDTVVQIEESPMLEFYGHTSDVLDLAWSNSNYLLSCSMDKTARLWQVGCDQCLNVFHHSNYVTCIQFNPVDENYFITGSIDGKVRIWGVFEKRVVDWADVRHVISAICYRPDGKGFIVGSIRGTCQFYEVSSDNELQLEAEVHFRDGKRTSSNKITGIQFSLEKSQRVMITSEDSKVRILDGVDVIHKFKGLPKSGSQMSASFADTEKHIISVGDDCRVYVWNYDDLYLPSTKRTKSTTSCEYFFAKDVSVAVQWSGMGTKKRGLCSGRLHGCSHRREDLESPSCIRDSERFSLGSWFSIDGPCSGGSATWPEEKLPLWDVTILGEEHSEQQQCHSNTYDLTGISETWGLVMVTAGYDGMIRTFHNYGLPVRL